MATNATSSKRSTAKHGGPFLWALSFIPLWLRNRQNLGTREPVLFLSLASARAEHLKSGLQTILAKPRAVIVASIPSSNDEAPQLRFDVPPEDSARRCEMFKPSPTFRPRGGHVHVALTYLNPARKTGVCLPSAGAAVPSSSFRDLFLRRRVTEHLLSGCAPFHLRLISRLQLR